MTEISLMFNPFKSELKEFSENKFKATKMESTNSNITNSTHVGMSAEKNLKKKPVCPPLPQTELIAHLRESSPKLETKTA